MDPQQVVDQQRARFDQLVTRQPELIRTAVQQILELPQITSDSIYMEAIRTPETFMLFLVSQLRYSGREVSAVDCPEPTSPAETETLERDFYRFRASFEVHLVFYNLHNDVAYAFLIPCPPGGDTGMDITTLEEAFESSALGNRGNTDGTDLTAPRLLHLLRLALPNFDVTRRVFGTLGWNPNGFCRFAGVLLHAMEHASPGVYAGFSNDRDSAFSFLVSALNLYTGAEVPELNDMLVPLTHRAVRREIFRTVSDFDGLGARVIRHLRTFPTWAEMRRNNIAHQQTANPQPFRDLHPLRQEVFIWNMEHFQNWWLSYQTEAMALVSNEQAQEFEQLGRAILFIDQNLIDGVIQVPRVDYMDVGTIIAQRAYYRPIPPPQGATAEPDPEEDSDDDADSESGGDRCPVCVRRLGAPEAPPGPGQERRYTLLCCGNQYGRDCATQWIEIDGRCPLCRTALPVPPRLDVGSDSGSDSGSGSGSDAASSSESPSEHSQASESPEPSGPAVWPPANTPATIDEPHNWFARVFLPRVQAVYATRGDNTDRSQALRQWVITPVRPSVQQDLLQRPLQEAVPLTRILNL